MKEEKRKAKRYLENLKEKYNSEKISIEVIEIIIRVINNQHIIEDEDIQKKIKVLQYDHLVKISYECQLIYSIDYNITVLTNQCNTLMKNINQYKITKAEEMMHI